MPFVTVTTNTGPADFHYDIATPTNCSAESIDSGLPTVLFIHASWTTDEIFERKSFAQFSDPTLRQFNLVSIQLRGYGETRGKLGDAPYTPKESAEDIWNVMEALSLPAIHVFAVSIGTAVALELACRQPERILSMTLAAPLPPTEDEAVKEGRLEVYKYWEQAHVFEGEGANEVLVRVDDGVIHDVIFGAAQLYWNNESSALIDSVIGLAVARAKRIWSGSRENINEAYRACVSWDIDRRAIPDEELEKIRCRISIIHFRADVAYSLELAHELAGRLKSADNVDICDLDGAHLGSMTNPMELNPILRRTILEAESKINKSTFPDIPEDAAPLRTPFTDLLAPFASRNESDDSSVGTH